MFPFLFSASPLPANIDIMFLCMNLGWTRSHLRLIPFYNETLGGTSIQKTSLRGFEGNEKLSSTKLGLLFNENNNYYK